MRVKRVFRYFRPGALSALERELDLMSGKGWQAVRPGRLFQVYTEGEGAFLHRIDHCTHRPGSAGEISWMAARERAGWSVAARRKGWVLLRRPAADPAPEEEDPRESVRALFRQRIARLESLRRWMLVLGALLLVGGYVSDLLPVLYSTALPMAVALLVTYRIKWMEEGIAE